MELKLSLILIIDAHDTRIMNKLTPQFQFRVFADCKFELLEGDEKC